MALVSKPEGYGARLRSGDLLPWMFRKFELGPLENEGVAPDIEVEQTPADVMAGRDPQLEKAIEVVLQALKSKPTVDPKRPPYPVKGKTLRGTVK